MADSNTTILGMLLQGDGLHSNEWGALANINLDRIDAAARGYTAIALSGIKTLTANDITTTGSTGAEEAYYSFIEFTGTSGTVTAPADNLVWTVYNNADANFTFEPAGGTGITLNLGQVHTVIYHSGTTSFIDVTPLMNSVGIDDNATGERLNIEDTGINLGTAGSDYQVTHIADDRLVGFWGGSSANSANIKLYGGTHASNAGDFQFSSGSNLNMLWDESGGTWAFRTGSGAKLLAVVLENDQSATFSAAATFVGGIDKLTTATGVVSVAAATAPTSGQALTATSGTVATWQDVTASAGGSTTEFQYNNTGSLAGMSEFVFANTATTTTQFAVTPLAGLTSGDLLNVTSNLTGKTGNVVNITQDHASSSAIALQLQQDGTGLAFDIIHTPVSQAVNILSNATTTTAAVNMQANGITSGSVLTLTSQGSAMTNGGTLKVFGPSSGGSATAGIAQFSTSNISAAINASAGNTGGIGVRVFASQASRTVPLVDIVNDNATGSGVALSIQQDQGGAAIELTSQGTIKFPATATPSADVNTLDDYQEGTWTPAMRGASVDPTQSYATQLGRYTKIGDVVYFSAHLGMQTSGVSGGTGTAFIDGLPFGVDHSGAVAMGDSSSWGTTIGAPTNGYFVDGTDELRLETYDNDAGNIAAHVGTDSADVSNFTTVKFSGFYFTDD